MRAMLIVSCLVAVAVTSAFTCSHAWAAPCSSYGFTPIFCDDFDVYCTPPPDQGEVCDPGTATPDDTAFHDMWPADSTCDPVSIVNYLLSGSDVLGSYGALNVQHGPYWSGFHADYIYRHVHDLTSDIQGHPSNTIAGDAINGSGPIDMPLNGNSVPPEYVDSMSRTLRAESLKGTFYIHPLDGVNKAGMANMVYYHELYLNDDRAPTDFTVTICTDPLHFTHDCNCANANPDATCDMGDCDSGKCRSGTCGGSECMDNLCYEGLKAGQPCSVDSDCTTCFGGLNHGQDCTDYTDCDYNACEGGTYSGEACTTDADCGTCLNGPNVGEACSNHDDCGVCLTGNRPGNACADNHDCAVYCAEGQDATCDGGINDGTACTMDSECIGTARPVLVHTDGQVHASFAIGMMSIMDGTNPALTGASGNDPCDLDQGYYPSEWRMVVYDGLQWHTLKHTLYDIPPTSPPDMADFFPLYGWNRVDFAIGQDYIEVRLTNIKSQALHSGVPECVFHSCIGSSPDTVGCLTNADCAPGTSEIPNEYWVARIPRQYFGPFNKYALGPGKGRDISDPQNPGPETCLNALSSSDVISDEIVLYDGVFNYSAPHGACCQADRLCDFVTQSVCNSLNGEWHQDISCDDANCCYTPWADADGDKDVDQVDFGIWQACFSGNGNAHADGDSYPCACFNREGSDNDVDENDFINFEACWSGPTVEANTSCGGGS